MVRRDTFSLLNLGRPNLGAPSQRGPFIGQLHDLTASRRACGGAQTRRQGSKRMFEEQV